MHKCRKRVLTERVQDLAGVYRDVLKFLPQSLDPSKVAFRVTNNVMWVVAHDTELTLTGESNTAPRKLHRP